MIQIVESKDYNFLKDIAKMLTINKNIDNFFFYIDKNIFYVKIKDIKRNQKILKIDNSFCEKYLNFCKEM